MDRFKKFVSEQDLIVYTDGSCEPVNPYGNMGWGYIVKNQAGEVLFTGTGYEEEGPKNSNNVAEYMAFHDAMICLIKNSLHDKRILFRTDSRLVVMQMNGFWRIKEGFYRESAIVCQSLYKEWFKNSNIHWIPRELNSEADALSKAHQDEIKTH